MIVLLDTHLLLWAAAEPHKLSKRAIELIQDPDNEPVFSAASIWEVAIKTALKRSDFQVSSSRLRRGLFDNGYDDRAITGRHAAATGNLPDIHEDPFDRILIAQAQVEDITLFTNDRIVASHPANIEWV